MSRSMRTAFPIGASLIVAALALAWPGFAAAQELPCAGVSDFPCSYQLRALELQKVPPVFKLQARVAQAKLPVGEGLFSTVVVKLLRGLWFGEAWSAHLLEVAVRTRVLGREPGPLVARTM